MNNNLIQSSSNEVRNAENAQQRISQKELEIQLVDINSRYMSSRDASSYYYNQQKKQLLEIEISSLKSQRDGNINMALLYALMLAERELIERPIFSSASIALANICSFLKIQSIPFVASYLIIMKISTLYTQLQRDLSGFVSLRRELANLKVQLQLP